MSNETNRKNNVYEDFKEFVEAVLSLCTLIEKYQGYFIRNLFRYELQYTSHRIKVLSFSISPVTWLKWKFGKPSFDESEILFLFYLTDNLHNVPEFAEYAMLITKEIEDCESDPHEMDELIKNVKENYLPKLINEKLQEAIKLITSMERRKFMGIKDDNRILAWCHELKALSSACERLADITKKLSDMESLNYKANKKN